MGGARTYRGFAFKRQPGALVDQAARRKVMQDALCLDEVCDICRRRACSAAITCAWEATVCKLDVHKGNQSQRSSIVQLEGGEILQLHRQQAQAAGSASEHALGLNKVVQQVDCCYSSQTTNSSPVDAHCARPSGCFSVDTTPTASGLQETHQRKR